jgi:hypothetical protein
MRNDVRLPKRTIQDVEVLSSEMRGEIKKFQTEFLDGAHTRDRIAPNFSAKNTKRDEHDRNEIENFRLTHSAGLGETLF